MSDESTGSKGPEDSDRTELYSPSDPSSSSAEDETLLSPDLGTESLPKPPPGSAPLPHAIGQYRIVGKLGEGGMGVVYLAEQQNPKRQVALKVVRGGQFVDEMTVKMFEREAETLGRLKHSNIGAIYESGRTDDGQHFFAMELVEGDTLDQHLARSPGPLSPEELDRRLGLFQQIADAVHYAHQRGVIHRDLKPANIVVTDRENDSAASASSRSEVKILDFGLARLTESDTAATTTTEVGMIKGTLPYMSPEQAVGQSEEIDVRTDVYALGVILYEMLTGQRPYDTDTSLIDAIRVIREQQPTPMRQTWNGTRKLDPDIATIVGKALEKDADRRYTSAAGFSEDVGRFLGSLPILARPPSATYQLKKLVGRNKLATAFAAVLLVLLLGFGIWMSFLWRQTDVALQKAEASKLLALGRLEAGVSSASALAYALASLEKADDPAAREFALENLQMGPMPHIVANGPSTAPSFSPDGSFLSLSVYEGATELRLIDGSLGSWSVLESASVSGALSEFDFSGSLVLSKRMASSEAQVWSVADGALVQSIEVGGNGFARWSSGQEILAFVDSGEPTEGAPAQFSIESWPLDGSLKETRGVVRGETGREIDVYVAVDPVRGLIAYSRDDSVYLNELETAANEVLVGDHPGARFHAFRPGSDEVASASRDGEIRLWSTAEGREPEFRVFRASSNSATPQFSPDGSLLAAGSQDGTVSVWDLEAPPGAAPMELQRRDRRPIWGLSFHPSGDWLAVADNGAGAIWSLERHYAVVLPKLAGPVNSVGFDPQGRWVAASSAQGDETVFWPLTTGTTAPEPLLGARKSSISPDGKLFLSEWGWYANLETGAVVGIEAADPWSGAFSLDSRYAAVAGGQMDDEQAVIRLHDLESLETRILDPEDGKFISDVLFTHDGRLISAGSSGIRIWDLETDQSEVISEEAASYLALTEDDRTLLTVGFGASKSRGDTVWLRDLVSGEVRQLTSHGERVMHVAVDPEGEFLVTGDTDGVVRVGPLSGGEPHLLLGHSGLIHSVAIDPEKRWLTSGGIDGTVRLWPIPEGQPFHTLPLSEIVGPLRGFTNYRVVPDDSEKSGFRVDVEPFAGWESSTE